MIARARLVSALWGLSLATTFACATTPAPVTTAPVARAREYMPLAVGNSWDYRVTPAPQGAAMERVEILELDERGFFVDNKGARLAPRTDGVFDGQRFLLQEPLREGHSWIAVPEPSTVERYTITAVGAAVTVPAGRFFDCVEVEAAQEMRHPETGARARMTMTWTYAPGVGLVKAVGRVIADGQPPVITSTLELVSFLVAQPSAVAATPG